MRKPEILMTPGPTPVPAEVLLAQASPIVYHRGPGFGGVLRDVIEGLRWILDTKNQILTFTSSGTGAMESAVTNCFSPGDKVIVANIGNFGKRWVGLCKTYGLEVKELQYEWGKPAKAADIEAALEPDTRGVFVQHSETSTGVMNDIEAIGAVLKKHPALYIVDAISSAGAVPVKVDEWGIDICAGGSQKALMMSPGIAFVSVSDAAWKAHETATCPHFYFDYTKTRASHNAANPETPYTPAVSLYLGMQKALALLKEEGLENVFARHRLIAKAVKEGCKALGLELFGEDQEHAFVVTALKCPEGVDGSAVTKLVRSKFGIVLAPGQDKLKGKIFRVGHLGYFGKDDIFACMAALEMALTELGHPVKGGSAVAAAEQVFAQG